VLVFIVGVFEKMKKVCETLLAKGAMLQSI